LDLYFGAKTLSKRNTLNTLTSGFTTFVKLLRISRLNCPSLMEKTILLTSWPKISNALSLRNSDLCWGFSYSESPDSPLGALLFLPHYLCTSCTRFSWAFRVRRSVENRSQYIQIMHLRWDRFHCITLHCNKETHIDHHSRWYRSSYRAHWNGQSNAWPTDTSSDIHMEYLIMLHVAPYETPMLSTCILL